jgi:hypothetical protein
MRVRQLSKSLVLSCLIFLATLPALAQNEINKKPLQDFAANLNNKLDKGEVELDKPFSVTLEGYLTKDGKFDAKRSKFTKAEGNIEMVKAAKDAIEAVGNSGILVYLFDLGVEKITVNFLQNETSVLATFSSELANENKAKTIAGGFSGLMVLAKRNVKEGEVKTLQDAINFSSEGKMFLINFAMPKAEAQRLLKNELQKVKEKSYSSNGE